MAQTHTKKAASNILTLPEWSVVDHDQEFVLTSARGVVPQHS
jgi:hypothetical protein